MVWNDISTHTAFIHCFHFLYHKFYKNIFSMFVINLLPLNCLAVSLQILYHLCQLAPCWFSLLKGVHDGNWKAPGGGRDGLFPFPSFTWQRSFFYQFFFNYVGLICFSCSSVVLHNILQNNTMAHLRGNNISPPNEPSYESSCWYNHTETSLLYMTVYRTVLVPPKN